MAEQLYADVGSLLKSSKVFQDLADLCQLINTDLSSAVSAVGFTPDLDDEVSQSYYQQHKDGFDAAVLLQTMLRDLINSRSGDVATTAGTLNDVDENNAKAASGFNAAVDASVGAPAKAR